MKAKPDSILDEVRRIRDEHAKQFNYDLDAIVADIQRHQVELKKQGWKFVEPPRRKRPAVKLAE